MRFIYILILLISCAFVSPVKAISTQDLQDTSRFTRLYSQGDTGGGDGKYIDHTSMTHTSLSDKVNRIDATIYVVIPSHDKFLEYRVRYDYELGKSFRHLNHRLQWAREDGMDASYSDLWAYKVIQPGITGTLISTNTYKLDGSAVATRQPWKGYENISYITPTDFDYEGYKIANRVYKMVYGMYYDDIE